MISPLQRCAMPEKKEKETKIEEVPETRGAMIIIGIALNENEISRLLTGTVPEHRML